MENTYLYFHINLIKHEVFYVGIGDNTRPYSTRNRNDWWHNIVNKYGYEVVIIHENLIWEEACALERKYIKQIGRADLKLGPLVNLTDGGDGKRGWIASIETKQKMSLIKKGKDTWNKGKIGVQICSENTKKLISIKNKKFYTYNNVRKTDEYKKKMSDASGTKTVIIQYDKNFKFIKEYDSINNAAQENNIRRTTISACLRGILKHAGNFLWEYK